MLNHAKAIKLLYHVENPKVLQLFGGDSDKLERELERMARKKFKFVFSIFLCNVIQISTLLNARMPSSCYELILICRLLTLMRSHQPPQREGGETRLFSTLADGHSELMVETGRRRPKFRIELPGNPIIGDGKSDNQNHANTWNATLRYPLNLLLDYDSCFVLITIHFQSSSILICGLCY